MESDVILRGVTGSRAHGTARDDSDTDRAGIYAQSTAGVLGLGKRELSRQDGDHVLLEAGHALRLALASNPSVLELLWLPQHEVATDLGWELLHLRTRLVSAKEVRHSYLIAAQRQFRQAVSAIRLLFKMDNRAYTAEERDKIRKRILHTARLLFAVTDLWDTGNLHVRLSDTARAACTIAADEFVNGKDLVIRDMFRLAEEKLAGTTSLPESPDTEAAERWLLRVRREYWKEEGEDA